MFGYAVKMPRPRKHDEASRKRLIRAAERQIARRGAAALSVREIAKDAGTSTWAVYSLFGSFEGLVTAVATQAFDVLEAGLTNWPETDDPLHDLVDLGSGMYRDFVIDHPWLFRLAFQRVMPELALQPEFFAARARTWVALERRFERVQAQGLLGPRTVTEAAVQFNALCEGLGNAELRGGTIAEGDQGPVWRGAFEALLHGFSAARPSARRASRGEPKRRARQ